VKGACVLLVVAAFPASVLAACSFLEPEAGLPVDMQPCADAASDGAGACPAPDAGEGES
jgi:hypothetical protein